MNFLTFGEILLRLTPSQRGEKLFASQFFNTNYAGSESNVATSLAILANPVHFVSKLPKNQLADSAIGSLKNYGINTQHILRGGDRIGIYFIEIGASIRPSSVIYDRQGSSISMIKDNEFDWENILENTQCIFLSGITPALSESCARETIKVAKIAKKLGVQVSFDMNYRRTLWGNTAKARKIFDDILKHTDLLFGNVGVLNDVYSMDISEKNSIETTIKAAERAKKEFGINHLAFTSREHISASKNLLSAVALSGSKLVISKTYDIEILDRFGAGDAFAAAYLHALGKKWTLDKSIEFATAAFALKHTILGDQHTSSEKEIQSIMEGNTSGHVIR